MTLTMKPNRPRRWKPSPREQAIYHAVVVAGRTQRQAGADFGRSQSAVSRLLKRFERWRGGARPDVSGDLDPVRQAHLDRWLARQRHEEIYARSMRLAQKMEDQPASTQRTGNRGCKEEGQSWWEETKRDQLGAAGQMLKTALRANLALEQFPDKEPLTNLPEETDPGMKSHQLIRALCCLRRTAEEAGRVPSNCDTVITVESWLGALVGEGALISHPREYEPGTARAELARAILGSEYGPVVAKLRALAEADEAGKGSRASGVGLQGSGAESPVQSPTSQVEACDGAASGSNPQSVESQVQGPKSQVEAGEDAASGSNPQSAFRDPQSPPPTHQTHTRIFVGGHPPPRPPVETEAVSPEGLKRWDPLLGGGRVVMLDPATGKKYGEPADDYADDPLGRLHRKIEDRLRREAAARARAGG